jgi:hypothetical protein
MPPIHHRGRSGKRLSERLRLATSRVPCFLWAEGSPDEPLRGYGFISDISSEGAGIYLNVSLPKTTKVSVAIEDEAGVPYRGAVLWCRRHNLDQRFHSQAALDFLIGVQLIFDTESEQQRYLMYFNDLCRRATSLTGEFRF